MKTFLHYQVLKFLKGSGSGSSYLVLDTTLNRKLVLKVQRNLQTRAIELFTREANFMAYLGHPSMAKVHSHGFHKGLWYFTRDWIEGMPLGKFPSPSISSSLKWCEEIAEALAIIHNHGYLHLGLHPSNIIITPEGRPVLTDLGLAREGNDQSLSLHSSCREDRDHCSPEQLRGHGPLDFRSDLYSLGVILHELVTGLAPGRDPSSRERANVPASVQAVLSYCLKETPKDRYLKTEHLARDLGLIRQGLLPKNLPRKNPLLRATRQISLVGASLMAIAIFGFLFREGGFRKAPSPLVKNLNDFVEEFPGVDPQIPLSFHEARNNNRETPQDLINPLPLQHLILAPEDCKPTLKPIQKTAQAKLRRARIPRDLER